MDEKSQRPATTRSAQTVEKRIFHLAGRSPARRMNARAPPGTPLSTLINVSYDLGSRPSPAISLLLGLLTGFGFRAWLRRSPPG
jgi:hypothetical protein